MESVPEVRAHLRPDGLFVEMNMAIRIPLLVSFLVLLGASAANAEAVRFDVEVREDVLGGRSWGLAGAYERLAGRIHFEVDPQNSANRIIRDIDYAPLNAAGPRRVFGRLLPVETEGHRGGQRHGGARRHESWPQAGAPLLQRRPAVNDPRTEADFGDGFLMRQGFTLLYVGWQFDVPEQAGPDAGLRAGCHGRR